MPQDQAVIILVILITGGVVFTPLGILFVSHRRSIKLRKRHKQPRRR
jgi:hypothetical protein